MNGSTVVLNTNPLSLFSFSTYFLHKTDGVYFSLRGTPIKKKIELDDGTVLIPLSKKITLDCGYIKRKDEALSPIAEEFVNIYKEFAENNDVRD